MMWKSLIEIYKYRELLYSLVIKDLKVRYKQSFLGVSWALFSPLFMMLIFTFVFNRIANISTGNIPYPVFVYSGLLPWTFFSAGLSAAVVILTNNANLVTKVYFPREVFPLSVLIAKFVDFCVASLILLGLMLFYGIEFRVTVLFIPLVFFLQLLLMAGLAFLLSMGNLFFRDVKHIFDSLIVLWMFATSVIYPIKVSSPLLQNILVLNPMTPFIDAYRVLLFEGMMPQAGPLFIAGLISIVVFFIGVISFHQAEYLFAENI